ncbi:CHAT domain-containing protein [Streptomyces luteolifulvus]|uniref:CHAT domain-containing protein n=1 Tax=Streptomyces luteolifulvus TaxID=2615112 RepID=A0A6H9UZ63_9ACTN|nr:CHAT domain-containing protein [Streptomyces luteolifulvus]KAB1144961.1 CHAT domain-containing protein [Streptomyces luteolifulvus]
MLNTESTEVRLDDPAELEMLHALPRRIAELRSSRAGHAAIEEAVRARGEWIARTGLSRMTEHLKALGPVVVHLQLPTGLRDFEALPWEMALVDGVPLVQHGVMFVRGVLGSGSGTGRAADPRDLPSHLRMLALFSLPQTTTPVDLGAHRADLRARLLDLSAGGRDSGTPLELRTRQFGVSRDTLRSMLREPAGWDVIHIVAHGLPGGLCLERRDGTTDRVSTRDLVELLGQGRGRTRLVFLSACWSGGQEPDLSDAVDEEPAPERASALTSLASAVAEELGCAVVAMRFPVGNDFARIFAVRLYTHLFRSSHTLPQALRNTLAETLADPELPERRYPLLCAATPMLYGAAALTQSLPDRPMRSVPPRGPRSNGVGALPDRPRSFVGRLREMMRLSSALAPESGVRGAVVHGVTGMGATTCAALLAHDHREAFDVIVWHPRPASPEAVAPSIGDPFADLLRRIVVQVPELARAYRELPWPEWIGRAAALRLLLVLDAADRAVGQDPRFADLVQRFAEEDGPGRILLTSRAELPALASCLPRTELPPLDDDEMWQILRTLPRLGALSRVRRTSVTAARVVRRAAGRPDRLLDAERRARTVETLEEWLRDQ